MFKKTSYVSLFLCFFIFQSAYSAGVKQRVISSGTKIDEATENTVVSSVCKQKFYGCMDSFCMLDNTNGGRCACSDRKSELDEILAEIDKIDAKSKQMATEGVENVKMGEDGEAIRSRADAAVENVSKRADLNIAKREKQEKKKSGLDLSIFDSDVNFDEEVDNVFSDKKKDEEISLADKKGKALYDAVSSLCKSKMQECSKDSDMLSMMYSQQIKSDCGAYENYLQQRKKKSAELLAVAEREVRTAALDKFQEENKYDLGECVSEYSKCMVGHCGDDYSKCVGLADLEKESKADSEMTSIRGFSSFSITKDTFDIIMSKKTQCDSVTKYCKKHASGVWMEYLKSAMPILKSAELTTQSNRRMNCLGEVSNCFLKACKDRIDPNNKEGSYDLCLAQPDAVKHLCQKQLNECGKISKDGDIFEIVKLRLGAMRVDSCTKQVKECLTNEDSCGKDYANCIGMDLESFKSICPVQKLVACSVNGKNIKSMDELDNMLQGIYISIDNKMATACQARVDEIFNKECPEGNCERLFESTKIDLEKNSPIKLDKKDNGDYVLSGLIHYGALKIEKKKRFLNDNSGVDNKNKEMMDKEERDLEYHINIEDYLSKIDEKDDPYKNRVSLYLDKLDSSVSSVINKFKSDPVISKCINGRDLRQINGKTQGVRKRSFTEGRFPSLLDSVSNSVMKSAIDVAQSVYADTYAKELKKMTDSQSEEVKKAMCYAMTANTASWKCNKWKWWYCSEWEYADMMDSLFTGKEGQILGERGGKYSTSYTMAGAKLSEMLKLTKSANKTLYTTDPKSGSMLGSSEITTTYSEGICYLKTVSTSCKNVKDIWEDKHIATKKGGGGFISVFGAAGWGYSHPIIRPQYSGQRCTEFNEPKESIQQIKI